MRCKSCDKLLSDLDYVTLCNKCLKVSIGTTLDVDLTSEHNPLEEQLGLFVDLDDVEYLLLD